MRILRINVYSILFILYDYYVFGGFYVVGWSVGYFKYFSCQKIKSRFSGCRGVLFPLRPAEVAGICVWRELEHTTDLRGGQVVATVVKFSDKRDLTK